MNKDRRRVVMHRPSGFQHYDMFKPERDADLKNCRISVNNNLKREAKAKLKEIEEANDRGFVLLIHDKKKSTYTKAQKKGAVLIKKAIV